MFLRRQTSKKTRILSVSKSCMESLWLPSYHALSLSTLPLRMHTSGWGTDSPEEASWLVWGQPRVGREQNKRSQPLGAMEKWPIPAVSDADLGSTAQGLKGQISSHKRQTSIEGNQKHMPTSPHNTYDICDLDPNPTQEKEKIPDRVDNTHLANYHSFPTKEPSARLEVREFSGAGKFSTTEPRQVFKSRLSLLIDK